MASIIEPVMRRALAAVIAVFILANGVSAAAACAGWQSSPAERMACCKNANDGCSDQMSADACCARTEQGQQPFAVGGNAVKSSASFVEVGIAFVHPADSLAFVVAPAPFARSHHLPPPRSPVVRSPILRI